MYRCLCYAPLPGLSFGCAPILPHCLVYPTAAPLFCPVVWSTLRLCPYVAPLFGLSSHCDSVLPPLPGLFSGCALILPYCLHGMFSVCVFCSTPLSCVSSDALFCFFVWCSWSAPLVGVTPVVPLFFRPQCLAYPLAVPLPNPSVWCIPCRCPCLLPLSGVSPGCAPA